MRAGIKKAVGKRQKLVRQARERKRKQWAGVADFPAIHEHTADIDLGSWEHWVCCPPGGGHSAGAGVRHDDASAGRVGGLAGFGRGSRLGQFGTVRVLLLKVAAVVRVSVRRIWVSLSSPFPRQEVLTHLI